MGAGCVLIFHSLLIYQPFFAGELHTEAFVVRVKQRKEIDENNYPAQTIPRPLNTLYPLTLLPPPFSQKTPG